MRCDTYSSAALARRWASGDSTAGQDHLGEVGGQRREDVGGRTGRVVGRRRWWWQGRADQRGERLGQPDGEDRHEGEVDRAVDARPAAVEGGGHRHQPAEHHEGPVVLDAAAVDGQAGPRRPPRELRREVAAAAGHVVAPEHPPPEVVHRVAQVGELPVEQCGHPAAVVQEVPRARRRRGTARSERRPWGRTGAARRGCSGPVATASWSGSRGSCPTGPAPGGRGPARRRAGGTTADRGTRPSTMCRSARAST